MPQHPSTLRMHVCLRVQMRARFLCMSRNYVFVYVFCVCVGVCERASVRVSEQVIKRKEGV